MLSQLLASDLRLCFESRAEEHAAKPVVVLLHDYDRAIEQVDERVRVCFRELLHVLLDVASLRDAAQQ